MVDSGVSRRMSEMGIDEVVVDEIFESAGMTSTDKNCLFGKFVDESGVYERCGACYGAGALPVNELIQKLRCHARHSKDGRMSEECVVPKALLADAADKLEEVLKLCSV